MIGGVQTIVLVVVVVVAVGVPIAVAYTTLLADSVDEVPHSEITSHHAPDGRIREWGLKKYSFHAKTLTVV